MDSKTLQNIRKDYSREKLSITETKEDPMEQFSLWFKEAMAAEVMEPNAMTLSTATSDGTPSSRVVLLKGIEDGFVFYTNYNSRKGQQLLENPKACLNFFWPELERQVRIEGIVEKVSAETSDAYFNTRPYESKVGAHASPQSQKIEKREVIKNIMSQLLKSFTSTKIPRPAHWGGYCLKPNYIEFWQGRPSRLHDRICYERLNNRWNKGRLAP